MNLTEIIAKRLNLRQKQVESTIRLLSAGATIPFISRYRKEATLGLNEVEVALVKELNEKMEELVRRRKYILTTIQAQGKLTEELRERICECWEPTVLEDIYLPFKPKRKTRAQVARKRGLEPLAEILLKRPFEQPSQAAKKFVGTEVKDEEEALQGARDILAEFINEDERTRQTVRKSFELTAQISSKVVKGKEAEASKYRLYFDWHEPLKHCSSHRLLAMRRGEAEGFLRVSISPANEDDCMQRVARPFVRRGTPGAPQVEQAALDAYKRLLKPGIETEYAAKSKARADQEAINVFADNLKELLLTPPLGRKRIMGIDPGFRSGCKVVCLDESGNLLHNETIFPHPPQNQYARAGFKISRLSEQYHIEAIAIGNGTAGRETEDFVKSLHLKGFETFLVSEDGASVYSASKIGRKEFPDYDLTVRGAVSIGRRLADPLAELVKIDPKSIGVGQYQHDVDQGELKRALERVVESCVNGVGVNLNTASQELLTYVSGLGPGLAKNIVDFRAANGAFTSREGLLSVPRLGAKAFEQCAGFLRIPESENPLDHTAVHPERYPLVEQMAKDAGCDVASLIASPEIRAGIDLEKYCTSEVGLPTLSDIMEELAKPGRDPRGRAQVFTFDERLHELDDLQEGMQVPGVVTNITKFGCFVDLGIKVKGLIHISKLSDRRVSDPAKIVHIQQKVMVEVLAIDQERQRISLRLVSKQN